ncbi:MAG TPA: hypothetical protein VKB71_17235, partial [Rhizomicrobium sp.]|nr:hypothetical protein [Rhizomicrobium sp.]
QRAEPKPTKMIEDDARQNDRGGRVETAHGYFPLGNLGTGYIFPPPVIARFMRATQFCPKRKMGRPDALCRAPGDDET